MLWNKGFLLFKMKSDQDNTVRPQWKRVKGRRKKDK